MPLLLRCAIVTYKLFFNCIFEKIERKTGISARIAAKIMKKIIFKINNNNFNEILIYIKNANRQKRLSIIIKKSQLSIDIRKIILKHNISKSMKIINKKNLFLKLK